MNDEDDKKKGFCEIRIHSIASLLTRVHAFAVHKPSRKCAESESTYADELEQN